MISVSVMEGDSITLNSDVTAILRYDRILWFFGPSETRIADINDQVITIYDQSTRFKDKLQLDNQTGSLTIKNITTTNSGLYKLTVLSQRGVSHKTFTVTVSGKWNKPPLLHFWFYLSFRGELFWKCDAVCSLTRQCSVWFYNLVVPSSSFCLFSFWYKAPVSTPVFQTIPQVSHYPGESHSMKIIYFMLTVLNIF